MEKHIFCIALLIACTIMSLCEGMTMAANQEHHDDDHLSVEVHIKQLQESVDELKATVAHLQERNEVHFYFHGDDHHHAHDNNGHHKDSDDSDSKDSGHNHHVDENHIQHDDTNDDHHDDDKKKHHDATIVYVHLLHDDHKDHGHNHNHEGDSSEDSHEEHSEHAICELKNEHVHGHVHFEQKESDKYAKFSIEFQHIGSANEVFSLDVRQYGDISGDDCHNVGGLFDPYDKHFKVGDLGHVTANDDGAVTKTTDNTELTLFGFFSVVGRSITVHDANGNSVACCVIGISEADEVIHD